MERRFGPPGYGETPRQDRRLQVAILHLPSPIDVCAGQASEALHRVTQIQLQDLTSRSARDKHVRVRGTLHQAVLGGEYTDAVMGVVGLAVEP